MFDATVSEDVVRAGVIEAIAITGAAMEGTVDTNGGVPAAGKTAVCENSTDLLVCKICRVDIGTATCIAGFDTDVRDTAEGISCSTAVTTTNLTVVSCIVDCNIAGVATDSAAVGKTVCSVVAESTLVCVDIGTTVA